MRVVSEKLRSLLSTACLFAALLIIPVWAFTEAWIKFGATPFDGGLLLLDVDSFSRDFNLPPEALLLGIGWAYSFGPLGHILSLLAIVGLKKFKIPMNPIREVMVTGLFVIGFMHYPVSGCIRSMEFLAVDVKARFSLLNDFKAEAEKSGRPEAADLADKVVKDWFKRATLSSRETPAN